MDRTADPIPPGTRLIENLAYVEGGDPRQVLDLYLPPGDGPHALVVYLHGGGLVGGIKEWARKEAVATLLPEGFAVAAPSYRFVSQAPLPAPLEDARAACRWLKANAVRLGIDPARVGLWGYSAGTLLAGLLATTAGRNVPGLGETALEADFIRCVLLWASRCDLSHLPTLTERGKPVVSTYLGGPVEDRLELARQFSPRTHVHPGCPPFLIVHGEQDPLASVQQVPIWENTLRQAGVEVSVQVRPDMTHDIPDDFDYTQVKAFFTHHLRG